MLRKKFDLNDELKLYGILRKIQFLTKSINFLHSSNFSLNGCLNEKQVLTRVNIHKFIIIFFLCLIVSKIHI